MGLQINTSGWVLLDGKDTGLAVGQRQHGTVLYTREKPRRQVVVDGPLVWVEPVRYAEHKLPHARYMLGSDSPITKPGVATRAQFEADVRALLAARL
jgi:hypothetical protein